MCIRRPDQTQELARVQYKHIIYLQSNFSTICNLVTKSKWKNYMGLPVTTSSKIRDLRGRSK